MNAQAILNRVEREETSKQRLKIQELKARTALVKQEQKAKEPKSKFRKIITKVLSGKIANKGIIKPSSQMSVEVHQSPMGLQKMDRDKSRFFKDKYEEEKRSLFFS